METAQYMQKLTGRKIIVTGAASGIGKAVARLFVEHGARLALFDISAENLADVAQQLGQEATVVDISSADAVLAAVDRAADVLGGLDGLVNVAGIHALGSIEDTDPVVATHILNVNLLGPWLTMHASLPHLRRAGTATIVNVASTAGVRPVPNMAIYSASKAGVIALGSAMRGEAGVGIRVNTVCPGITDTPLIDFMYAQGDLPAEQLAQTNQLGRLGTTEEIANVILFLSCDESSFVSSATLSVCGGQLI